MRKTQSGQSVFEPSTSRTLVWPLSFNVSPQLNKHEATEFEKRLHNNGRGAVGFTVPINLSVCPSAYISLYPPNYLSYQLSTHLSVRPFIFVRQITHSSASATTALRKSSPATDDPVYIRLNHTMLDRPYVWSVEKKNGLNTNCSSNYAIYLTKWLHT